MTDQHASASTPPAISGAHATDHSPQTSGSAGSPHLAAPFADALAQVTAEPTVPFSTPGHKRGRGAPADMLAIMQDAYALDIPHGGGVDTTHMSLGLLRAAERLAADLYGGDDARLLVNGSTTGNMAMLLATCGPGDEVLISRTLHRSLLAALIFSGARPIWLTPELDGASGLPLDVDSASVERTLAAHPAARAVVLVSPSYIGVTSDLTTIAGICHARGVPLLVDEAWGPHFHLHPDLPPSAMQAGADASVASTHKMLGALTQGSTLVMRRGLLDIERMHTVVDMVQTTSPSVLIFASLDASRRHMALHGEALLLRTLRLAHDLRTDLATLPGLRLQDATLIANRPGAGFDPCRLLIDVQQLGLTGYQAEETLRADHGIFVEMSDLRSVMLLITIGDDDTSIARAFVGFRDLAQRHRSASATARDTSADRHSSSALLFGGEQVLTPRAAFMAVTRAVALEDAAGEISAESITPYPPGIPLVTPGERIPAETIAYVRHGVAAGMYISGLSDPTSQTVRVVTSARE